MNYYKCQLVGEDAQAMINAVNQGIDSRLRAVTDSKFDWYVHLCDGSEIAHGVYLANFNGLPGTSPVIADKLHCRIAKKDLATILLRMLESDNYNDWLLADDIVQSCANTDIDEIGIFDDDTVGCDVYDVTIGEYTREKFNSMDDLVERFWDD